MTANHADAEAIENRQRELRASRLASYVQMVVDQAPPLTQEQRDRVAAALGRSSPLDDVRDTALPA